MTSSNPKFDLDLLKQLSSTINGEAANAAFACGGSIPVTTQHEPNIASLTGLVSPPVTLRWDTPDSRTAVSKVSFPVSSDDEAACASFKALLDRCQPATFGVNGRDILDETYRKAGKLDDESFCTDFHPHDCGIMDAVQQNLIPSTVPAEQIGLGSGSYGIRAELYKLNVYSAPSGKFQAHVDTPRGPEQFGSLVVCLPYTHEGGTLRVKHRGQITDFAWADRNPQAIAWAAFFGDCEHEVLEVTKGHRVTLTYNLYRTSIANLARPVAEPERLPLYGEVKRYLQNEAFMPDGGKVGFFCNHQYAHAHEAGRKSIPAGSKGVDLALFTAFHALGMNPQVRPILKDDYSETNTWGGLSVQKLLKVKDVDDFNARMADLDTDKWCAKNEAEMEANEANPDYDWFEAEMEEKKNEQRSMVGTDMHVLKLEPCCRDDIGGMDMADEYWPHEKINQIVWLNDPSWEDYAHMGVPMGNEPSLDWSFSAAAILVTIPPVAERATNPVLEMQSKIQETVV